MFLVGVAGGSGSGKTTFAKKAIKGFGANQVRILHQDAYYLSRLPDALRVHGEPNFDHPEAFDWELFGEHLGRLKQNQPVDVPIYDFVNQKRTESVERIESCDALVVEGIYTLWRPEIRALFDIRVFIDVDADIRFIRRLHRDVRERGRSIDSIIRQYHNTVRPMFHAFLEPTQQYADLIVGEESDVAAEVLAARVRDAIESSRS